MRGRFAVPGNDGYDPLEATFVAGPSGRTRHAKWSRPHSAMIRLGHVESSLLDCGKTCTNGSRASSTLVSWIVP
ncbi:hypothetical protein KMM349_36190 [Stenotrophomonas maltophilia]|nr:hypothetical protein KMM349_36190 [Stenotrophomonas maltophilia]